MVRYLQNLINDGSGFTAIEYALIASLISVLVFAGSFSIGSTLKSTFTTVSSAL